MNAGTAPATKFITFADTQTGIAYANPSTQVAIITISALNLAGSPLATQSLTLLPGQHASSFVGALLGLSTLTGSVQITSTAPIISLSLNFEASPVFSSLPPGELDSATALSTGR